MEQIKTRQRMQGESFYYFQIANAEIDRKQGNTNIAKADSIIQCVLFYRLFISNLTTTQNLSFPFNYFEPPTPNGKKGGGGGGKDCLFRKSIFFGS